MKTQAYRWIGVAAIISVGVGAALSHLIEPGVRAQEMTLAEETPTLKFIPTAAGPHPVALPYAA